jgi:rhamnogalacturonyl hydrolase YesR
MQWFLTSKDAETYRKTIAISAVPIANPDGWAAKKGPGNLSGGVPAKAFPPKGPFYATKTEPEAAYLWRWIGMHAPDMVYVFENSDKSTLEPLIWNRVAGAGPVFTYAVRIAPAPRSKIDNFKLRLQLTERVRKIIRDNEERTKKLAQVPKRKAVLTRKDFAFRQAKAELQRRVARTPTQVARQLAKRYGHDLNSVVYIPAVALIGRVRLGELTGEASHLKDVEKIVAPYVAGKKDSLGKRVSGSHFPGHLVFAELARVSKDRAKRKRYVELVRRAADLGFDKDGKPKEAMPYHLEMSDSVFMGCPILVAAGKLTGEAKYYDMALRHMRFMLKLNLRTDGLHRHSPLNETAWGRGNGFPALGLALCLTDLPKDHPGRKEMLTAFRNHMSAMAKHQDYTGAWHQVVDRPESYRELTVTCMTTFAMIRGIRHGWLDEKTYGPIVKRAWTAIKTRVAPDATLVDVCTGTGKQRSLRDYYDRPAILGYDARGGAMALLVATEMAAWEKERGRK